MGISVHIIWWVTHPPMLLSPLLNTEKKDILTQRDKHPIILHHDFLVEELLAWIQENPLLFSEIHSHIFKGHKDLVKGEGEAPLQESIPQPDTFQMCTTTNPIILSQKSEAGVYMDVIWWV